MALTINNFVGFETGGLEECDATSGSISVGAKTIGSGTYDLTGASSGYVDVGFSIAHAGNDTILGFRWRNTTDPTSILADFRGGGLANARVAVTADDKIEILDASLVNQATATNTLSGSTTYFIEIVFTEDGASGAVEVFVDGVSHVSATGIDTFNTSTTDSARIHCTAGFYINDIYIMSGATSSADCLGDCEIYMHVGESTGTTPEVTGVSSGPDALDAGTWDETAIIPINTDVLTSYDSAKGGADEIALDSNITEDPIAAKMCIWMYRDGGGACAHYGVWGNNTDGSSNTKDIDPTTDYAFYSDITESASIVPTASESVRVGMEIDASQDFNAGFLGVTLLHVPSGSTNDGAALNHYLQQMGAR